MSTITLYAGKINEMPGLINDLKKEVKSFGNELTKLYNKSLKIDSTVCDISEEIKSIRACTKTQEERVTALENLYDDSKEFIEDTIRIDNNVAETVNKNKRDFYKKYEYLRPDSEKSGWERFWKDVGSWCKEHWKAIATIAIVIAAIAIIVLSGGSALGPLAPLLLLMAKGALIGAAIGGLSGGVINAVMGRSFWEGVEDGAFNGAITGILSAGIGYAFTGSATAALSFGQTVVTGAASNGGASLLGNLGDLFIAGKDISLGEFVSDFLISGTIGGLFAAGGYWLNGYFAGKPSLTQGRTTGRGSWSHVWKTQLARSLAHGTKVSLKTIMKGFGADIINGLGEYIISPLNDFVSNWLDLVFD